MQGIAIQIGIYSRSWYATVMIAIYEPVPDTPQDQEPVDQAIIADRKHTLAGI